MYGVVACMSSKAVTLSQVHAVRAGNVATLSINRPDRLNTVTPALIQQLRWAFDDLCADDNVEGIVIAAEGKVFSVGAEIEFLLRNLRTGDMPRIMSVTYAAHDLFTAIDECPKPVVARVHGVTIGAGLEMILACDRIVACPQATFSFPETGLGIFPCLGGTQRTPRAIGGGLSKWLMYTGRTISAADALRIGLINSVVPLDQLDAVCYEAARTSAAENSRADLAAPFRSLAEFFDCHSADDLREGRADTQGEDVLARAMRSIAPKAPIALRIVERLIDDGSRRTLADGLAMEIEYVPVIYRTSDAFRGLTHLASKKFGAAKFDGR